MLCKMCFFILKFSVTSYNGINKDAAKKYKLIQILTKRYFTRKIFLQTNLSINVYFRDMLTKTCLSNLCFTEIFIKC